MAPPNQSHTRVKMKEIKEVKTASEQGESSSAAAAGVLTGAQTRDTIDHAYFTFGQLAAATGNFRRGQRIKKGSTADIFRGNLGNNKTVAIKRLKSPLAKREEDYARELNIRFHLCHPNIIKMIGSCSHEHERLIVYEAPFDMLPDPPTLHTLHDDLIDRRSGRELLGWRRRMNIASGVAKGLSYLHNEADPQVTCNDLNASCIILEDNFQPRLLDIGIEKFCVQPDIYRFGLLLFEIVTGEKARDCSLWHFYSSVETRVKKVLNNGNEVAVADRKIRQRLPLDKLHKALSLVLHCLHVGFPVDVSPHHYRDVVERAMEYLISANPTGPWPITSPSYNPGLSLNYIQGAYNPRVLTLDPRVLTLEEIRGAYKNLPEVDRFQIGFVIKGNLNGEVVAIKWLSSRMVSVYEIDVRLLSRLSHPNIIKLVGYCAEADERILVYEFMHNRSLSDLLLAYESKRMSDRVSMAKNTEKRLEEVLPWKKRMQIAKDVAKALEYLHYEANPPVIYGDLKPSNILLDASFMAKLSDFGSAQSSFRAANSHYCPYWSPERILLGRISVKSDVFNFGMILFEILIGDHGSLNKLKDMSENAIFDMVERVLIANLGSDTLRRAIKVGSMCISNLNMRPNMHTVVQAMNYLTYDPGVAKGPRPEWPQEFY